MATKMRELLGGALTSLRYEPTEKRIRIYLDGEPQRLVPIYAVPEADVTARLESAGRVDDLADESALFPTNPFTVHSCPGEMVDVVTRNAGRGTTTRSMAGFTLPAPAFSATRESPCSGSAPNTSPIRASTPAGDAPAASGRGAKRRRR
jgi:hypothetical protein